MRKSAKNKAYRFKKIRGKSKPTVGPHFVELAKDSDGYIHVFQTKDIAGRIYLANPSTPLNAFVQVVDGKVIQSFSRDEIGILEE